MSDDLDEFELQLKQEAEAVLSKEKPPEKTDGTYKDEDGVEYEWDEERRAWFPKVDTDLIAAYQMNYGVDQANNGDATQQQSSSAPNPAGSSLSAHQYETTEDGRYLYMDAQTGIKYEWNTESNQWVKQTAAAVAKNGRDDSATQPSTSDPSGDKKRKAGESAEWFDIDDSKNTNVYVSGLPEEKYSEEEFAELMSKCGIVAMDNELGKKKVKLYRDPEGNLKGDGLCCYLKRESVDLALQLLDGTSLVGGRAISVQLAKFQKKEGYQPPAKKKKKKKKAKKNTQEKLLAWHPEKNRVMEMTMGSKRMRHEKVVILKHAFHPSEFEEDATLITEISDDLKAECSKYGEVSKVMIFDRHPEGVASVRFKEAEAADRCVAALNGRWFAKRQLTVETWDGQTDYKIQETDLEREERMKNWEKFLEN